MALAITTSGTQFVISRVESRRRTWSPLCPPWQIHCTRKWKQIYWWSCQSINSVWILTITTKYDGRQGVKGRGVVFRVKKENQSQIISHRTFRQFKWCLLMSQKPAAQGAFGWQNVFLWRWRTQVMKKALFVQHRVMDGASKCSPLLTNH